MDSLSKVALLCALAGLIGLAILSGIGGETAISAIGPDDVGGNVRLCGNISTLRMSRAGHIFATLSDGTGEIDVVIFNSTAKKLNVSLELGDRVCLGGRVDIYKGELEFVARSVEIKYD